MARVFFKLAFLALLHLCESNNHNNEVKVFVKSGIILKKSSRHLMGYRSINTIQLLTSVKKPVFLEPTDVKFMKEAAEITVVSTVTQCINSWDHVREEMNIKLRTFEESRFSIIQAIHVNNSIEDHVKNESVKISGSQRRKRGSETRDDAILQALHAEYRFDNKVVQRVEQLKSAFGSEFWSLACMLEASRYRAFHLDNLHEYVKRVDLLLEWTLQGLRGGPLIPNFLEPDLLQFFVWNHTAFTGTLFRENPQYLYQVSNIRLTGFENREKEVILEYDLEFPVIQEPDIYAVYITEQVGFRRPGGHFSAEYETPVEIALLHDNWVDVRKLCGGESVCNLGLQGTRKDATSCLQAMDNNCIAIPSNVSRDAYINTDIGALVNTIHGVEINYHNGKKERTSGGTEFVSWAVADSVSLANMTLKRPLETKDMRGLIIDQNIIYSMDLNYSISVPFTRDLTEKGLHAKLWKLNGAIRDVQEKMNSSPFIANIKLVILVGAIVIISFPIIVLFCRAIYKKAMFLWNSETGRHRDNNVYVPARPITITAG